MSWGMIAKCGSLYLSRESYNSKDEVEDKIKEEENYIQYFRDRLLMYLATADIHKFCDDPEKDPALYMRSELDNAIEEISRVAVENYKREVLLDCWDESAEANKIVEQELTSK